MNRDHELLIERVIRSTTVNRRPLAADDSRLSGDVLARAQARVCALLRPRLLAEFGPEKLRDLRLTFGREDPLLPRAVWRTGGLTVADAIRQQRALERTLGPGLGRFGRGRNADRARWATFPTRGTVRERQRALERLLSA